jgi:hypothetical protein
MSSGLNSGAPVVAELGCAVREALGVFLADAADGEWSVDQVLDAAAGVLVGEVKALRSRRIEVVPH